MAERRMFSKSVIDSDMFLDMPLSAQALYFHLGMHGDDDGFISNPKRISRAVGCNNDDIKILIQKGFIIPFESGVVVIRDWKINNPAWTWQNLAETIFWRTPSSGPAGTRGRSEYDSVI